MAFFNKLFFSSNKNGINNNSSNQSQNYISNFPFNTDQVRILLYRECDNRGRRLLFDSNSIEKINLEKNKSTINTRTTLTSKNTTTTTTTKNNLNNGFIEISDDFIYKYSRPNSTTDITGLGEMIFGALAMSFRGTALKIHWLQSPLRILCSQVFLTPIHSKFYTNDKNINSKYSKTKEEEEETGEENPNSSDGFNKCENQRDSNTSFNSFTMPLTIRVNRNLNLLSDKDLMNPLQMPSKIEMNVDNIRNLQSMLNNEDSGFSVNNDLWSTAVMTPQYSTGNSLESESASTVFSGGGSGGDPEYFRKLSLDSGGLLNGDTSSSGISSSNSSNTSSDMSLKRRISRNVLTSFENRDSLSDFIGFVSDNYQTTTATNGGSDGCVSRYHKRTQNNLSNPEMSRNSRNSSCGSSSGNSFPCTSSTKKRLMMKRPKLGLAICITMTENYENEMEQFCCEHIALLESMLYRLRALVENAYINHRKFLHIMIDAWQTSSIWLKDLFTAPRLHTPVWLNVSNNDDTMEIKHLADKFVKELTWLLSFADTKNTNFFISTMLTGLLTYHLGWVLTIDDTFKTSKQLQQHLDKEKMINEQNKKFMNVANNHPYNALWAQIGDLYGSIGNPPKTSRTIIYGKDKLLLEKFLNCLTYFIRCGEVKRSSSSSSSSLQNKLVNHKIIIDAIVKNNENKIESQEINRKSDIAATINGGSGSRGLTRSPTCFKNLLQNKVEEEKKTNKKVDMKNLEENYEQTSKSNNTTGNDKIRFTVTTPENIELPMDYSELQRNIISTSETLENEKQKNEIENGVNEKISENSKRVLNTNNNSESMLQNSIRIPQIVENFSDSLLGFSTNIVDYENRKKELNINEEHNNKNVKGVVFVLGDNEALINIKKSNEYISVITNNVASLKLEDNNKLHSCNSGYLQNIEIDHKILDSLNTDDNADSLDNKICMNAFQMKTSLNELNDNNNVNNNTEKTFSELNKDKNNLLVNSSDLEKTGKIQINLIQLPLLDIDDNCINDTPTTTNNLTNNKKIRMTSSGFIPSLFIGVNDHYIPDMVLQGTLAEPKTWEIKLKQDLTLSSYCATLMPTPVENVAVIGDVTKWDVKVISSQSYGLPCNDTIGNPIGMSQLVSTMLETFYTMSCSGISAYECLCYIELKLQEIYLQSQTLAEFLLVTEFCSLNTVAKALDLSINDVPLLLSVASVHSPQVTKKYGISFR